MRDVGELWLINILRCWKNVTLIPFNSAYCFLKPRRGVIIIVRNNEMKLNPEGVTEIRSVVNHTIQTDIFHHIGSVSFSGE